MRGGCMGNETLAIERTHEAKLRRQQLQAIQNPPEDEVARRWRLHEEHWAAKERQWKEDERKEQEAVVARERAQQEAARRESERRQRVRDFEFKESLINEVFEQHDLTPAERGRVNERLAAMGDVHNTDAASIFAQEQVLNRSKRPATQSTVLDWRDAIREVRDR
jgi:hypothetical protein